MEMKVILNKQIHSCFASVSSKDAFMKRDVYIPFLPVVGMIITDKELDEKVVEVAYDIETNEVVAYLEPDKTFYERGLKEGGFNDYWNTDEFKEKVQYYKDLGWY